MQTTTRPARALRGVDLGPRSAGAYVTWRKGWAGLRFQPAGPGPQVALLGDAGGGFRGAPVVLACPGSVAGLLQQVCPHGQQPVMPGHALVTVQRGQQGQASLWAL